MKLIDRFRRWLILKLGGFPEQYTPIQSYFRVKPVTLDPKKLEVSTPAYVEDFFDGKILEVAKQRLCARMAEMLMERGDILFSSTAGIRENEIILRGTLYVLEGKRAALLMDEPRPGYNCERDGFI